VIHAFLFFEKIWFLKIKIQMTGTNPAMAARVAPSMAERR
jgi:hypothetical protein